MRRLNHQARFETEGAGGLLDNATISLAPEYAVRMLARILQRPATVLRI